MISQFDFGFKILIWKPNGIFGLNQFLVFFFPLKKATFFFLIWLYPPLIVGINYRKETIDDRWVVVYKYGDNLFTWKYTIFHCNSSFELALPIKIRGKLWGVGLFVGPASRLHPCRLYVFWQSKSNVGEFILLVVLSFNLVGLESGPGSLFNFV